MRTKLNQYLSSLWQNSWLLLFSILLQTIIVVQFTYISKGGTSIDASLIQILIVGLKAFTRSVAWAVLFWGIIAYFGSKKEHSVFKPIYTILLYLFLFFQSFLFLGESFLLARYQTVYSHEIISILTGTNPREANEFFQNVISDSSILWSFLVYIFILLISLIYRKWSNRRDFSTSILWKGFVLLSLIPFLLTLCYSTPRTYKKVLSASHTHDYSVAPFDRVFWNTFGYIHDYNKKKEAAEAMASLDLGDLKVVKPFKGLNLVVIIGETLRRDYLHCYGYPLNTTPKLDSLLLGGNLVKFNNVVSSAPNTIGSLTKVLTFKTFDGAKKWYEYPSLCSTFSKAGYWEQWTSNQESTGEFIQDINILAVQADETDFVNDRSIDAEHNEHLTYFDEDVLPALKTDDEVLANHREKKNLLQIVHLIGSHPIYKKRFPKSYAKFKAQDVPIHRSAHKDQMVADYVNSVYYNDYVVSEIIKHYEKEEAIVIYFSDHGEVIYDDPRNPELCDHGMTKEALRVPFFVYISPTMQSQAPMLLERMKALQDRPIMTDAFTRSLAELVGIQTKFSNPQVEFFSEQYDESRPRVIENFSQKVVFTQDDNLLRTK